MATRPLTLAVAVLATLSLSGCMGDLVLPKSLHLRIEYAESDAQSSAIVDDLTFNVTITDPDGAIIMQNDGTIEEGFARDFNVTFESVGPYQLDIEAVHPDHGMKEFHGSFDFNYICRDTERLSVVAVYQGGNLEVDVEGGGTFCALSG